VGEIIGRLRRAPGEHAERDRFNQGESIDPTWVSFLISKPPLEDATAPRWLRIMQPLLSGVFTVDNLDYVRRDAYMTGVQIGAVDVSAFAATVSSAHAVSPSMSRRLARSRAS
jgi:hypothetical protein